MRERQTDRQTDRQTKRQAETDRAIGERRRREKGKWFFKNQLEG